MLLSPGTLDYPQHFKNKLQKAQNKLLWVILKVHPHTYLDSTHFKLVDGGQKNYLLYIKMLLTYKIVRNVVPKYLINYFHY